MRIGEYFISDLLQISLHTDKFCKFVHAQRSLINTRTRTENYKKRRNIFVTKFTTPEVVEIEIERRKRADTDLFLFFSDA